MKKTFGFIFVLVFVGGLLAAGGYTLSLMRQPLGPPLELDVPPEAAAPVEALAAAPAQQAQERNCGNSGTMTLLVSGVSMPQFRPVHGVGAVRLVWVDFSNLDATILDVPRALWVETPNIDGVEETSLTVAYKQARDNAQGNNPEVINRKATQEMAQVLVDQFGFVPDHYITVDPQAFVDLVDDLGGVTITLEEPVDGTPDDLGTFPAGEQTLSGQRALDFVRIIHPAGDPNPTVWDKFDRQQKVVRALLFAVLNPSNWDKIDTLVKDARKMVVTDLSVDQALDLACMVKEVDDAANIREIPPDMVTVVDEERIDPDVDAIRQLIEDISGQ